MVVAVGCQQADSKKIIISSSKLGPEEYNHTDMKFKEEYAM